MCEVIRKIASGFGVDIKARAIIDNHSYDIPEDAGLKVVFNPKHDIVERLADVIVRWDDPKHVLPHLV